MFLLGTTLGLKTVFGASHLFLDGSLSINNPTGNLFKTFSFDSLKYQDKETQVELQKATISYDFWQLFYKKLRIESFLAKQLTIHIKKTEKASKESKFKLPINLDIKHSDIELIKLNIDSLKLILEQFHLSLFLDDERWKINTLNFYNNDMHVHVNADISPFAPYPLNTQIEMIKKSFNERIHFHIGGDQSLYHWKGSLSGKAMGEIHGHLKDLQFLYSQASWQLIKLPSQIGFHSQKGQLTMTGSLNQLRLEGVIDGEQPIISKTSIKGQRQQGKTNLQFISKLLNGDVDGQINLNETNKNWQIALQTHNLNLGALDIPLENINMNFLYKGTRLDQSFIESNLHAFYQKHPLKNHLIYQNKKLKNELSFGKEQLNLVLLAPRINLSTLPNNPQISAHLEAHTHSLQFLEALSSDIKEAKGTLDIHMNFQGKLKKPDITGSLRIKGGVFICLLLICI